MAIRTIVSEPAPPTSTKTISEDVSDGPAETSAPPAPVLQVEPPPPVVVQEPVMVPVQVVNEAPTPVSTPPRVKSSPPPLPVAPRRQVPSKTAWLGSGLTAPLSYSLSLLGMNASPQSLPTNTVQPTSEEVSSPPPGGELPPQQVGYAHYQVVVTDLAEAAERLLDRTMLFVNGVLAAVGVRGHKGSEGDGVPLVLQKGKDPATSVSSVSLVTYEKA